MRLIEVEPKRPNPSRLSVIIAKGDGYLRNRSVDDDNPVPTHGR